MNKKTHVTLLRNMKAKPLNANMNALSTIRSKGGNEIGVLNIKSDFN